MSDLPELRGSRLPERPPEPRQLFDKAHTYGVAHDLERMRAGLGPPPRTPRTRPRVRRLPAPWTAFRTRRADTDRAVVRLWHALRCRTGHHDFHGGGQMQLGSRFVYIERRCSWCDAAPTL